MPVTIKKKDDNKPEKAKEKPEVTSKKKSVNKPKTASKKDHPTANIAKQSKETKLVVDGHEVSDGEVINMKEPTGQVSLEYPDGTTKNIQIKLANASNYIGATVNVGISLGLTVNIGNYENVKAQVSIHIPCSHEEIEDTYEFAKEWADDKLEELQGEIETHKE